jgi:hypothetical protein
MTSSTNEHPKVVPTISLIYIVMGTVRYREAKAV